MPYSFATRSVPMASAFGCAPRDAAPGGCASPLHCVALLPLRESRTGIRLGAQEEGTFCRGRNQSIGEKQQSCANGSKPEKTV